jgi:hypothetical protein
VTVKPTSEELRRWALFLATVGKYADDLADWRQVMRETGDPTQRRRPSHTKLGPARRRVRNCRLPEDQQFQGSPLVRLVSLIEAWPTLDVIRQISGLDALRALVVAAGGRVTTAAEIPSPRFRADLDG